FSFNLCVMFKYLSLEYRLYACSKNVSQALILNENHHFAKGSSYFEKPMTCLYRLSGAAYMSLILKTAKGNYSGRQGTAKRYSA
ncbi:MAG: hypothetical protein KJP19_05315, partial [Deltaproteobacteria bacterium]|nr:hypothetical protein [Deltaproteobacteria bacterium]